MRIKAMVIAVSTAFSFSVGKASAQSRFDVGLLLGTTRATDEGAVLQFDQRVARVHRRDAWPVAAFGIRIPVPDARYLYHRPPGLTDLVLRRGGRRLRAILRIEAAGRPQPEP